MLSFNDLKKKLSKLCVQLSNEYQVPLMAITARIKKDSATGEIRFTLYVDNSAQRIIPYEEVLGIKGIDMLGKTQILKMVLPVLLTHFVEKLKCTEEEVSVIARAYSDDDPEIVFGLYKGTDFIEWIDPDSIKF
jgi:hypothetical protein